MKVPLTFVLCGLSTSLSARTKLQTFTSPDGMFRFKYSNLLVRCAEQRHEKGYAGLWIPVGPCNAYIPVCNDPGSQGSTTLVCLGYPKAQFKDYLTFEAATFSVSEIKLAVTERDCLSGSPDWVVYPPESGKTCRDQPCEVQTI